MEYESRRITSDNSLVGRVVSNVRRRVSELSDEDFIRSEDREVRLEKQSKALNIPLLPTTTIGSFPQTLKTRNLRKQFKSGEISIDEYNDGLKQIISETIEFQENLGIDVLVHGEAERNDMVEYFGELLEGFAFSKFGWVLLLFSSFFGPQSPIDYGKVQFTKFGGVLHHPRHSQHKGVRVRGWAVLSSSFFSTPLHVRVIFN